MATNPALDDDTTYARLDSHGLLGRIEALPDQIDEAWGAGDSLKLPAQYGDVDQVVVLGMGGSGIGGALLQALAIALGSGVPVLQVRGYALPAFVGERSLVLASSNSGNTEETIAALEAAIERHSRCVVVSTGGRLLDLAREHDLPALSFKWAGEPRSALGWSFGSLVAICSSADVLPGLANELHAATGAMRDANASIGRGSPLAKNAAKQLAERLSGRLPVFIGAEALAPVAYRWRTQVNENAKSWAIADELPEMNHNAQEGYGLPRRVIPLLHAVFLRQSTLHPRIRTRMEATLDEMQRCGVSGEIVDISGEHPLTQMLTAVQFGDYVSYYLGILNDVEPSPVPRLVALKDLLAAAP